MLIHFIVDRNKVFLGNSLIKKDNSLKKFNDLTYDDIKEDQYDNLLSDRKLNFT